MTEDGIETEAKWRASVREHERLRTVLRDLGGTPISTVEETNTLFDTDAGELKRRSHLLRLRCLEDEDAVLTFKGPATYRDGVKSRSEIELRVPDRAAMIGILKGLGFAESLEYRKTREAWDLAGAEVALDTLEFGWFVEIEGTEEQVRRSAAQLGLDLRAAETNGYPSMMRAHLARKQAQ